MSNAYIGFGRRIDMILTLMRLGLHDGQHKEMLDL
jgi:hypothetical protein